MLSVRLKVPQLALKKPIKVKRNLDLGISVIYSAIRPSIIRIHTTAAQEFRRTIPQQRIVGKLIFLKKIGSPIQTIMVLLKKKHLQHIFEGMLMTYEKNTIEFIQLETNGHSIFTPLKMGNGSNQIMFFFYKKTKLMDLNNFRFLSNPRGSILQKKINGKKSSYCS